MSANVSPNREKATLLSQAEQSQPAQAYTNSFSLRLPRGVPVNQERHVLTLILVLLIIISIGALGSLTLAPHLLSRATNAPDSATVFRDGVCSTTEQQMRYLSQPQDAATLKLPASWTNAGLSASDIPDARACAASFIKSYQSFDSKDPRTLDASTTVLTATAKQRFYKGDAKKRADTHMDSAWRASIQKHHLQQTAQIAAPTLTTTESLNNLLLAWFLVPARLSTQNDGQTFTQEHQYTVLLVRNISRRASKPGKGTGWSVAEWREGKDAFSPTFPL